MDIVEQKLPRHIGRLRADDIVGYRPAHDGDRIPKAILARVLSVDGNSTVLRHCNEEHHSTVTAEVKVNQILFNLGKTPSNLTLLGVDTNALYQETVDVPTFGPIHWLTKPSSEDLPKKVHSAAKRTASWLKENGLRGILDLNIVVEVRPKHGKYAGCYRYSKDLNDKPGIVTLFPDNREGASIDSLDYVFAHELGHLIDLQLLRNYPKHRAAWVSLYEETVTPKVPDAEWLDWVFDKLAASADFGTWRKACAEEEEGAATFKLVLAYWKRTSRLSSYDIDALLQAEEHAAIAKRKPKHSQLADAKLAPLVSEYACKNVKELFAESFAFYVCDKKLPSKVTALIERALPLAAKALAKELSSVKDD